MENWLAALKNKKIRRTLHNNEWWFAVEDAVLALTDSTDPKQHIRRMKRHDPELGKGWGQLVRPLPIETAAGFQKMLCANLEGIFRIIQSTASPKAEPYKQFMATVGYEWIQEIEDPESASHHHRSETKPWGVQAPGSTNLSGVTTNLELIFSMLREAATTEIALRHHNKGFNEDRIAARKGGRIAREAREKLESETGRKVPAPGNYLPETGEG